MLSERVTMSGNDGPRAILSKSRFIAGVQCRKRVCLRIYRPELAAIPDVSMLAMLRQSQEVGNLARDAFPGGMLVKAGGQ